MISICFSLTEASKVEVMVGALSRFTLDETQMLPGIRQMLEEHRQSGEVDDWREEEYAA